ncbi:methanol/ethanol family PQQ-dependent dehydrogenase [Plasticicumulans acidivorans]|uniref:Alcohol dehydrogenase (Cytochrome c) n=1 Tax=Plasticicumulans acidivorans TaxID=886464 RepID=A0A317MU84_9GAMM|nr:methanol/ethanol family PQQ-dependent dehydrogenase [Plasticicumulans acidivorans]PWV60626.1 alcohol dehydrogenase (cytochrome c) [Plasticicumulans acidivorans]
MTDSRFLKHRLALGVAMLLGTAAAQAGVTDEMIMNADKDTQNVLTWGITLNGQRYSPLKAINADTVKDLVPAWAFSYGDEKQRGQEAQPLVYNGRMFVTASYSRLFALDARTGQMLWKYEHRLPDAILPCCDVINRGAALYGDLVIFATLDAQLVALNQETGKVVWKQKLDNYKDGYSNSAAPIVVKGLVITGVSGGEFGVVGRVDARDANTGKLVWSRPVIEGFPGKILKDGQLVDSDITGGAANKTWPGDMWQMGGGATWLGGLYDAETDSILIGTGNPAPWNAHTRPGDNLYTASSLAIDPATGKIKWHYQTTPNDGFDFDGVNELVSFDLHKDGKVIKAVGKADRNGFFYVLDRTDGKLLSATPFVTKQTWATGVDLKTGRPIETGVRPGDPSKSADGKKGETVFSAPSFLGGKNWMPMAYNKDTGLFYVPANEWGMDIWNEPISYKKGAAYLGAGFTIKPLYEDYIGALRAIDPATGKIVWEYHNPAPLWGGVLTTAGNLVFTGTPEGFLKAFDAKTGKELWKFQTGSGVVGCPVTWEMDGEQYIGVPSGWGGAVPLWGGEVAKRIQHLSQGGSMWVFKLHKS